MQTKRSNLVAKRRSTEKNYFNMRHRGNMQRRTHTYMAHVQWHWHTPTQRTIQMRKGIRRTIENGQESMWEAHQEPTWPRKGRTKTDCMFFFFIGTKAKNSGQMFWSLLALLWTFDHLLGSGVFEHSFFFTANQHLIHSHWISKVRQQDRYCICAARR